MIGPAHLILMFWFGGAICFASIMFLFAKFAPDDFEKTGVTLPIMVVATMVWPYAMLRAFHMVQQESQWRERRRVRFPEREPSIKDFDEPPQARLPPPPPPELCATCLIAQAEFGKELNAIYERQPKPCSRCKAEWDVWVEKNGVEVS